MRKTVIICLFTLMLCINIKAQVPEAGAKPPVGAQAPEAGAKPPAGTQTPISTEDVKTLMVKIEKIETNLKKAGIPPEESKKEEKVLSGKQKVLIMLPVILFILCLLITFLFARKYGFNFRKSFYCEEPEEKTIQTNPINNPAETIKITVLDTNGIPIYMPSVSRIIAFLSSLTTLSVIVCFISYYAYCMLKEQVLPEFKNLFEIIIALGLGIVPYGFNKITATTNTTSK